MQIVSPLYTEMMLSSVRRPSHMRVTFHYPTGEVTYTDSDIIKFTEKKTAHLVSGELPSWEVSIQLKNLDGLFNPNDTSGLHDMLVKGVRITYEWGISVPNILPYGYEGEVGDTYDPVYGMDESSTETFTYLTDDGYETIPVEAYGFMTGYELEWITGGEVFSDGDLSYDATTVTINAYDYLSLIDTPIYHSVGTIDLKSLAELVINETDYPEDESGKKIVLADSLSNMLTTADIAFDPDTAITPKEWLQTIAHAGMVKFYIDRQGYIHLDNAPEELSSDDYYTLYLTQQQENPKHSKTQTPQKLVVNLNNEYGDPVELSLTGGGEAMVVDNAYIQTTAQAENFRDYLMEKFLPYRNIGDIVYRGEPALDILDPLWLEVSFTYTQWSVGVSYVEDDIVRYLGRNYQCVASHTSSEGNEPDDSEDWEIYLVEAWITSSELTFDGTLSGALALRYHLGASDTGTVKINGSDNFVVPLGSDIPSTESITLTCTTDLPTPEYAWYYFTDYLGVWTLIDGETTDTLVLSYSDEYFINESARFKCTVNGEKSAIASIRLIHRIKSETSGYRGTVIGTSADDLAVNVPRAQTGDVVLLDNTSDGTAEVYGEAYVYNGEEWVATEESDALAMTYKDALELAELSQKTIYASKIFTDLLVANEGFITNLETQNITAGTGDGTTGGFRFRAKSRTDLNLPYDPTTNPSVFDVMYDDRKVFEVDSENGNVIFGDYETGNGLRWENSTNLLSVRGSGKFTGTIDHDALTTTDAVASQISVNFATKSAYYGQDLYNSISSLGTGGWKSASGSYG
ncbi:MAG: carbohydrate-binding protein, partial [Christensenellales bacterium]